ncbi:hypothetical protein AU693_001809 [Salmonella enterica subsp. diarizonae]|nr:hypothetical protein [Salmonella enterica subsp. diarizonae]
MKSIKMCPEEGGKVKAIMVVGVDVQKDGAHYGEPVIWCMKDESDTGGEGEGNESAGGDSEL